MRESVADPDTADIIDRAKASSAPAVNEISEEAALKIAKQPVTKGVYWGKAPVGVGGFVLRDEIRRSFIVNGNATTSVIPAIILRLEKYFKAPNGDYYCRINLKDHESLKRGPDKQFPDDQGNPKPTTLDDLCGYLEASLYFKEGRILTDEEYKSDLKESADMSAEIRRKAEERKSRLDSRRGRRGVSAV